MNKINKKKLARKFFHNYIYSLLGVIAGLMMVLLFTHQFTSDHCIVLVSFPIIIASALTMVDYKECMDD